MLYTFIQMKMNYFLLYTGNLILLSALFGVFSVGFAQQTVTVSEPDAVQARTDSGQLPRTEWRWTDEMVSSAQKLAEPEAGYSLKVSGESELPFTGLAVGWQMRDGEPEPGAFSLRIRSAGTDKPYGPWVSSYGYLSPSDSPSHRYWAMLYVTKSGEAHHKFELEIDVPEGLILTDLKITGADARLTEGVDADQGETHKLRPKHVEMPEIVPRSGWWGDLPESELNPDYSPTQIDISHSLVHHTVTANEPENPAQVIRQIWDWHVNDNGWLDIGYNFLIDHQGNIYQGRYNPNLEVTDVQGAHAGGANSKSVGIALLGQFEPGASPQPGNPRALALDALVKSISWRFSQKGIDPLSRDLLAGNLLHVISGHRDVSATACPGENLYVLLPAIREEVSTGISEPDEEITEHPFELKQNYPNPFRSGTTIQFSAEENLSVWIDLYTVSGDKIRRIFEGNIESGDHEISFTAEGIASGVYFYELGSGPFRQMKAMIYIK